MDLSKLRVEIYDFLAVIIPGLLVILGMWISLRGWSSFFQCLSTLTAATFTVVLLVSFAVGALVQETADLGVKAMKGERYFKAARDKLWQSATGDQVRERIAGQIGYELENVDVAFDYCLTRLQGAFPKRDLFVANSDLARSLILVCCFAIAPVGRLVCDIHVRRFARGGIFLTAMLTLALVARICWVRMMRFRGLSETPVFHAYLAQPK